MPGEPRRGNSLLSVLASSTLAALAVFVLVGVLILAFGDNSGDNSGDTDQAAQEALVALTTPSPTPSPASSPPTTPSPTPTPSPSESPTATPAPAEKAPVVVLNQTGIGGLAATFRKELEAAGWTVTGIDDFRGNVPATTVYFPPGMRPAAVALMAQFPQVGRIRPAFSGISTSQLTVILGKDFPTSS